MKYTLEPMPTGTIDDLAEAEDLEMVVKERPVADGDPIRYYASFKSIEVAEGRLLKSEFGNGATPEEAIQDYARLISLCRLSLGGGRLIGPWRLMSKRAATERP